MPPIDDSPYPRHPPERPAPVALWWGLIAVVAVAGGAAAYYYFSVGKPSAPAPQTRVEPPSAKAPAAPEPAIRHPLETASAEKTPLPALEESDTAMGEALAELLGKKPLAELLKPEKIIRRIVATVDNLPREAAPASMMPLTRTPGAFAVAGKGEAAVIAPANAARYEGRLRVLQAVDARRLVDLYLRFYPLFQKAYEELGYPKRYFNDRLVEVIDHLLAAPDILTPIGVRQPKVLYQYADAELEARSAGQKLMIRIGVANAGLVKAKLREIRREILARAPRK